MACEILSEVAFLFVEQFDNLYGVLVDRTEVRRIRQSVDDGEEGLYGVVASVFGDRLEEALIGAATSAMDYIAYVDETWEPTDAVEKDRMLSMEAVHMKSLETILHMARINGSGTVRGIERIRSEAARHFQRLKGREFRR